MPRQSISSAANRAVDTGFLDLMGEEQSSYQPVSLDNLAQSVEYVAAVYTQKLAEQLKAKDATSSGSLADSIVALDLVIMGSVYTVSIQANKYASFIDEGVSGWAQSRGSRFQFRTKGVNPTGDMVKSIRAYLLREGNISRNTAVSVSRRESKRAKITDATTRAAISTAYMIKRMGIPANHFWRDATAEMTVIAEKEFGAALEIDIVENITKK